MSHPLVLAITGASGAAYAVRLLHVLASGKRAIHLLVSPSGRAVIKQELGIELNLDRFDPRPLLEYRFPRWWLGQRGRDEPAFDAADLRYFHHADFMAPLASGSFLTAGMVICPCSGTTLAGIAHGTADNLIQRAADVHLKERRKLILVPRETPLSVIQLENMRRAAEAGAVVLPAMPGWYHGVTCLLDQVDFVVARVLDQLGIEHDLMRRWGEGPAEGSGFGVQGSKEE
jgi:4-hydroxy-3-polyprenylbenzoate decarboxylase